MHIAATAPGKIVLLGEYAVLEGWPALAMAVNRSVRADIDMVGKTEGCRVSAPGFGLPRACFSLDPDGTFRWQEGEHHPFYGLAQSVLTTVSKYHSLEMLSRTGFDIELDSTALFHTGNDGQLTKLGLGSSAALTTALALGLVRCVDIPEWSDERWMTVLTEAHRDFQKSKGSGVDVAASFCGGVIQYKRVNGRPCADRLNLPSELQLNFVWSGRAASTPGLLQTLHAWQQGHSREYQSIMAELGSTVAESIAAADNHKCADFVEICGRFTEILAELGDRAGLEIFSAGHLQLLAMAKKSGLVYKPCGAGGGDLGVAIGVDVEKIEYFIDLIQNSRFQMIDISPSPQGVRTVRSY